MLHFWSIRGTLEHHVFEKMSKAAAPFRLETEPNFVIHAHGHDRRCRVRRNDHVQAVG